MADTFYLLFLIFTLPGCVISSIFAFLINGKVKITFLILSAISIFLVVFGIVLYANRDAYCLTVSIISFAFTIPVMSTCVHTYKKRNRQLESSSDSNSQNKDDLIDDLIELKKLLNDGTITREEYDKKKTAILSRK